MIRLLVLLSTLSVFFTFHSFEAVSEQIELSLLIIIVYIFDVIAMSKKVHLKIKTKRINKNTKCW